MTNEQFYDALEEWIEHCENPHVQASSNSEIIRHCNAYKRIVDMGYEALPLIRRTYDIKGKNIALEIIKGHGLFAAVKDIVRDEFVIPAQVHGNISAMGEYTKTWLDKNIGNYVE